MLIQLTYILYKYGWFQIRVIFKAFIYRYDNQIVKMLAFIDASSLAALRMQNNLS
jgi:hypothetical protein